MVLDENRKKKKNQQFVLTGKEEGLLKRVIFRMALKTVQKDRSSAVARSTNQNAKRNQVRSQRRPSFLSHPAPRDLSLPPKEKTMGTS